MLEDALKEVNKLKDGAKVCIARQKEIIKQLVKSKKDILSNKEFVSEAKYFENLMRKIELLNQKNFAIKNDYKYYYDNYMLDAKYTLWLSSGCNTAYKKCYGKDYNGQYWFNIDEKLLAEKLLGKNLSKKTIYLNVIDRINECTWYDENPYFREYDDVYYPIKLEVYCDNNFDINKKYSVTDIKKLIKTKQIMVCNLDLDIKNKNTNSKLMNLDVCKYNFKLGKVSFSENDNIKVLIENDLKELKDSLVQMEELLELFYNYYIKNEQVGKIILKNKTLYPNFLQCLDETIKQTFINEVETETQKIDFIKEYYNYSIKKIIKDVKRELREFNKIAGNKKYQIDIDESKIEIL